MVGVMEAGIHILHSAWRFGNWTGNLDWQLHKPYDWGIHKVHRSTWKGSGVYGSYGGLMTTQHSWAIGSTISVTMGL